MINPFYLDLTDREISHIQDRLGEIFRGGNLILGRYPNTQVMYKKYGCQSVCRSHQGQVHHK